MPHTIVDFYYETEDVINCKGMKCFCRAIDAPLSKLQVMRELRRKGPKKKTGSHQRT